MDKISDAFDDFIDDCFIDDDPLCNLSIDNASEVVPSQIISAMFEAEGEPKTCLVSLMDEPKVA